MAPIPRAAWVWIFARTPKMEAPHSPPAAPRTSEFELSGFDIGVAEELVGNAGSLYATLARLQLEEFSVRSSRFAVLGSQFLVLG